MNKAMKIVAAAVIAAGCVSSMYADEKEMKYAPVTGFPYQVAGEVVPGEWTSQYTEVMKKATEEGIPVAVFFAKSSCGRCKKLEANMLASETFAKWAKDRGYLLLFGMLGEGEHSKILRLIQSGTALPQCGVWWDKDGDGKVDVGNPKNTSWTGTGATSEVTFMNNADKWLGTYDPIPAYTGGTFDFEESDTDRLECEEGQTSVSFDLTRDEKSAALPSETTLKAIGPDGKTLGEQKIVWEAGESNQTVTVDISAAGFTEAGQQVSLVLVSTDGVEQATNHVTYVEQENSFENPLWIGERTAPSAKNGLLAAKSVPALGFGEWTMDFEVAKALAASQSGDAYTLAALVGSLWCGDCANTEKNFTGLKDSKGVNRFAAWAKDNNVALAAIDVRRFDTNSVETTTGKSNATLLSRIAGSNGKSGRGYLTRKGVSDEDAAAILERNRQLVSKNTGEGGFHRPEDANAYRTGVPYFVLLRKDGTVASRFTIYSTTSPKSAVKFEDVIKRFDEMLAIAGKGGSEHADASEIENNHATTTPLEVEANGGSASGELSCTDLRDAYKLGNFAGNATLSLSVTGESAAQVELSLWQVKGGEAAMIPGAYRTGALSSSPTLEYTFAEAGDYYVQVAAKNRDPSASALDAEFSENSSAANNFTAYTLESGVAYYTPDAAPATAKAPDASKTVKLQLESGALYRLVGLDDASEANQSALEAGDVAGFYTAKQGGNVPLDAAEAGGTVTYQKWEQGAVGFEPDATTKTTEVTVSESTDVTIGVRRTTGVSGEVTVKISLNKEETDFYYDYFVFEAPDNKNYPRFTVDGKDDFTEKTVTWADGQSLEECVGSLLVQAADSEVGLVSKYFGPGKVVFDLTITAQTEAGSATNVVDNGKFVINFAEDQTPNAGTAAIVDAVDGSGTSGFSKNQTIYVRENDAANITVARLVSDEGPVYATLTPSVSSVEFGGDYSEEDGGIFWGNHDNASKVVSVTNLPAAGKSVKLTLKANPLSPELKVLSASNTVTIVSVAAAAPMFDAAEYGDAVFRYTAVSNVYPVTCLEGDVLSFAKVSGSLPAGLKASADPSGRGMLVSGVPTGNDKAGKTYVSIWQVTATRGRTKVLGTTAILTITSKDPTVAGTASDGKAVNASCATAKKFGSAMVFDVADDGSSAELVGMLTGLTIPATGKASAKFVSAAGTVSLSAKNWAEIDGDEESGDFGKLNTVLVGSGKNSGYMLEVNVTRDGAVSATLANGENFYEDIDLGGAAWSKMNAAADCTGYYTVTLPVAENPDETKAIVENRAGVAPRAAAYLTLTMSTASQANAGTMKWAGVLPNGTSVSGTSTLADVGEESVLLPYWKFSTKDKFAGVARIKRGAKAMSDNFNEEEESCYETVSTPELDFGDGAVPVRTVWRHTENSKATDAGDFAVSYEPYGGIYDSALGLDYCSINGRRTDEMALAVELPTASDVYGVFNHLDALPVKVESSRMTLSGGGGTQKATLKLTAKTGVVSGKFNLTYTDAAGRAKTVSATYGGVVQLGFGDACGCNENPQPFLNGFWYFSDKLQYENSNGRTATLSVKRGAAAVIDAAE